MPGLRPLAGAGLAGERGWSLHTRLRHSRDEGHWTPKNLKSLAHATGHGRRPWRPSHLQSAGAEGRSDGAQSLHRGTV